MFMIITMRYKHYIIHRHRSVSPMGKTKRMRVALQNGLSYGRDFIIMSQKWFLDIYELRFDIQMCSSLLWYGACMGIAMHAPAK